MNYPRQLFQKIKFSTLNLSLFQTLSFPSTYGNFSLSNFEFSDFLTAEITPQIT